VSEIFVKNGDDLNELFIMLDFPISCLALESNTMVFGENIFPSRILEDGSTYELLLLAVACG
jgi:hypothetical protein